jgi:fumarate reductase flavoprotein subunit
MNVVEAAAIQPVLWVNPTGERFCDEGIAFYDTSTGNINTRFKKGYSFSVFDDHIKEHFIEKGVFRGMGLGCLPGWKLRDLDTQIHHLLSLNSQEFVGSDSLDGLAAKMEVDPLILKETINQYNCYCSAGYDEQFAKDPQYLLPLKGPKYYAVRARTGFLGTLGGVRINAHCEAVNQYDIAIEGLYAVGLDAGGLHTESYSMRDTSGIASAFALISGRVAGEKAAQFINRAAQFVTR